MISRLLRGYFGKHWLAWCLGLLLLLFWPAAWFYRDISLDVPVFVTEWIKAGLTSFVILLLVEVVSSRRQKHERQLRARERVEFQFASALRRLLEHFAQLKLSASSDRTDALRDLIRRDWSIFHAQVTSEFLVAGTELELTPAAIHAIQTAPYARCSNAIESALQANPSRTAAAADLACREIEQLQSLFANQAL